MNGVNEGKGEMIWKDADRYEDRYEGEWKNGKFDDMGIYYFNNGDWYEGEFKNEVCIKSIYFYENGDQYEGEFKN